jgi:integrase
VASIHRRPNSKFWHAGFRGPDGRLILRSTKCTDRNKALAAALEFERASKLAGAGHLVEAQARKVVADIMERAGGDETLRTPSIELHFRQWTEGKKASKKSGTAARYKSVVDHFLEALGSRAAKPLTALTSRDVQGFVNARMKANLAPRTLLLDVKIIRTALNAARRQGIIPTNPAEAVELPSVDGTGVERGTFSPSEISMLVEAADNEWKSLILMAYFTGARLSDCCRMEWANVDLTAGTLTFIAGKTSKKLEVPLHPDLLAHLESIAGTDKPDVFIMPHMGNLKSGGRHGLSEGFKRIMRTAGLDMQKVKSAGVRQLSRRTFHALRHSFTSALANAGVTPELRMKLTGHKSVAVHRGYSHHEMKTLADAIAKMPGLGETKPQPDKNPK